MSEEPVLRPEEVAGVLSGEDVVAEPAQGSGEPQPYSLREPVAISAAGETLARERLEQVVAVLAKRFQAEAEGGIKVVLEGFQQQRAAAALSILPGPVWVTSLLGARGGGISLALQPVVAIALMDKFLGGPGKSPDDGREPTSLEARVVSRMIGAVADEIGTIVETTLRPFDLTIDSVPEKIAAPGETVCVSPLRFTIGEADHTSLLLASAALLVPAAGGATQEPRRPGPLARRLEQVSFPVRPVLAAGRIAMAELTALEPGKILKFDVPQDTAIGLRVGEIVVAHGRIRRTEEKAEFQIESRVGQRQTEEEL